ncbi:hypothetical protein P692DRAFT_20841965 [Suillus brevipes Sb2]|nr:hypothetical protein P692DRAFT_20841965 [Suillus brevipes Sb2]
MAGSNLKLASTQRHFRRYEEPSIRSSRSNFALTNTNYRRIPLSIASLPSVKHVTLNVNSHPLTPLTTIQLSKGSRTTLEFPLQSHHEAHPLPQHVFGQSSPHRLSDVLAITNDTPHFTLSTFTNTSATYADTFAALSIKLTYDPAARSISIS